MFVAAWLLAAGLSCFNNVFGGSSLACDYFVGEEGAACFAYILPGGVVG